MKSKEKRTHSKNSALLPRDKNRKREALCSSGSGMFRSRTILPSIAVGITARNIHSAAKICSPADLNLIISGYVLCCFLTLEFHNLIQTWETTKVKLFNQPSWRFSILTKILFCKGIAATPASLFSVLYFPDKLKSCLRPPISLTVFLRRNPLRKNSEIQINAWENKTWAWRRARFWRMKSSLQILSAGGYWAYRALVKQ